ncbi:unnamed protein product [Mytilus coruscus]|uniref:Uncharacterized protein n=1 Tax=Mytilus coruscus TaxID=42192 RepID=A0A6J8DJ71_MYTCO|nr:unnamed protein product [Mytilus coruscus]
MSDLRQREQRLKKREEELKIREKLNEEMQTERIWLQSYVTKLEMKINELENSNKILQKKCELINLTDDKQNQHTPHDHGSSSKYIEQTVAKLHEKVSGFILQQMDTQFDNIINQFNENVNNTCNSQPTNQRNTRCTDNSDIQNGIPIIQESLMTGFAPTSNTAVPRSKTATTSNQSSYSLQTQYQRHT